MYYYVRIDFIVLSNGEVRTSRRKERINAEIAPRGSSDWSNPPDAGSEHCVELKTSKQASTGRRRQHIRCSQRRQSAAVQRTEDGVTIRRGQVWMVWQLFGGGVVELIGGGMRKLRERKARGCPTGAGPQAEDPPLQTKIEEGHDVSCPYGKRDVRPRRSRVWKVEENGCACR
jgi:hypothetical protein